MKRLKETPKAIMLVPLAIGFAAFATSFAVAEENQNLMQPNYVGVVTGNDEKDTFGVKYTTRTQYFILMHQGCSQSLCDTIVTGSTGNSDFVGNIGIADEKNTFGFVQPAIDH